MAHARLCCLCLLLCFCLSPAHAASDPLPSWHEGPVKNRILNFVQSVTATQSPAFVPVALRLAVFDVDGTLWAEKPNYFPVLFAIERIQEMAPEHPEWRQREPFRTLLQHPDAPLDYTDMAQVQAAASAGMTPQDFYPRVQHWLRHSVHPDAGTAYSNFVYRPMLELLSLLQRHGFDIYLCSGAETEFLRRWPQPYLTCRRIILLAITWPWACATRRGTCNSTGFPLGSTRAMRGQAKPPTFNVI